MYSFPNFEPVHCFMSGSYCCFLTCIQVSQEAGNVIWYPHLFKNFAQFVVVYTVKGFSVVIEEVNVFLNSLAFTMIQWMLAIGSLIPLHFLNPAWTSGISQFMYCLSLTWRISSITSLACDMTAIVWCLNIIWHCLSLGVEGKLTFSSPMATAEFSKFSGIFSAAL